MADLPFVHSIQTQEKFFNTTIACFEEKDSGYTPQAGMMTVTQHVAHTAQTVQWFLTGAFDPNGFDMNFEKHAQESNKVTSLAEAKKWMATSCREAEALIRSKTMADFHVPIAGKIMGGLPRVVIFEALADHTAHHRGSLAVYARLLGRKPAMPYL